MSLPYFPLYPSDFEAKTSHLTISEDGAYNRLLRVCWMTPGCSMPADEAWIMRRVRAHTEDEKEAVRAVLDEFFTVKGGRYSNARLTKEWLAANEAHDRRKNAGSKGGKAKSLKTLAAASSNAKAMLKQPEPEPEPYIKEEEPKGSLSSGDDLGGAKPFDEITEAVKAYNDSAEASGWPQLRILSKQRRASLKARLKECGGLDGWHSALERARSSPHLCGQNDRGWTANFDFLTRQSSFAKLMEGNYDPRNRATLGTGASGPDTGMVAAFAAVAARRAAQSGRG